MSSTLSSAGFMMGCTLARFHGPSMQSSIGGYVEQAARMQIRARTFGPLTPVDDAFAPEARDYLKQSSILNSTFNYWCRQTRGAMPPLSVA